MVTEKYDLIVIGSGPAGEKGAVQAAYFGKKVALIEKASVLGGAAANTGTLPSKTLRESALFLSGFRKRELYGLTFTMKEKVTVRDFLARERQVKEYERTRIAENLKRHGVALYHGTASFIDPHTIQVQSEEVPAFNLHGEVILIATGSFPVQPPGFPFELDAIYDSDEILELHEIPNRMLVIGGGVIGCEYACMFAALGVQVTVVEKRGRLVEFLDAEISRSLQTQMADIGMRILVGDSVADLKVAGAIEVTLHSGKILHTDTILVSAGRCGNTSSLRLDRINLDADERGRLKVNSFYQTDIPNIYAAGDVIGFPALASTAMEQGRVAMVHAFSLKYKERLAPILPYGIFTIPECSMAGETEESLTKAGIPYVVGKAAYANNARGQIIGDSEGFLKLIFREADMKLLGVHLIGELATELVHIGLTALLMEAGANLFIETCYNYPTLAETYKYATYDALGRRRTRLAAEQK